MSKFSDIERGSRLIKERLNSLIIKEDLMKQEKKLFIEMFYNREKVLVWEFVEIGKVRLEVISS